MAVLSNGTTRLLEDLELLDLTREFGAVFNTAEIGVAKPDPGAFRHVLGQLGTEAPRTAFIDDLPMNRRGASGRDAHTSSAIPGPQPRSSRTSGSCPCGADQFEDPRHASAVR
ncbi:MAG: HAD-IA family hydrolase [Microthrixaceae bacterium]